MARSLAGYRCGPVLVNSRSADPANGVYETIADAVAETDERIDLAVMCIPAAVTAETVRQAASAGVRAAVVCAGGFAEAGGEGPPTTTPRPWSAGPWDEDQAKALLDNWGITTPPRRRYTERSPAQYALETLNPPLAVKILDATVLHKTEVGGVHLNVRTAAELSAGLDSLEGIGAKRFLVESMTPSGVDVVVGVRRDPVFGPVVLVGLGGTAAEAYGDVAIRSVPATPAEITAMVDDLGASALVNGWRGGPVLNRDDLVAVVSALSDALLSAPDVNEIEINPLRLTSGGLVALDAVIISGNEVNDAPTDH
jgi:acetate---CoA ligase (ADP-forming)